MDFHFGSTLPVKCCKIASLSYFQIVNAKPSFYFSNIHQEMENYAKFPVSHKLLELYIVQYVTCWNLYYYFRCITCPFQNSISFVAQEIDFQFASTLLVKFCKIASLSYISRAYHCTVYYHLNFISVPSMQNQFSFFLQMYNRKWNFNL